MQEEENRISFFGGDYKIPDLLPKFKIGESYCNMSLQESNVMEKQFYNSTAAVLNMNLKPTRLLFLVWMQTIAETSTQEPGGFLKWMVLCPLLQKGLFTLITVTELILITFRNGSTKMFWKCFGKHCSIKMNSSVESFYKRNTVLNALKDVLVPKSLVQVV